MVDPKEKRRSPFLQFNTIQNLKEMDQVLSYDSDVRFFAQPNKEATRQLFLSLVFTMDEIGIETPRNVGGFILPFI